jgi:hypothetical protein
VIEKLRERGVRMSGELMNDDPVRIQNILDPDGNEMYLFQVMQE